MSYEKLKEYVLEQKNLGSHEANIKLALEEKGWNNELINKALSETFITKEEENPTKLIGLLKNTWNNFNENLSNYLIITLISLFVPFIPLIIFAAPILYDVIVFKFTVDDFMSGDFMPLIFIYASGAFLITMIFALWGKLSITIAAVSGGNVSIKNTLQKAWKLLPSYIWVKILNSFIIFILIIPFLAVLSLISLQLIPQELTVYFICLSIIFLIPAIIGSIFLSFSSYSLVAHGARGFTAIRTSYKLVKRHFEFVFSKLLLFFMLFVIVSITFSMIPIIGELAKVVLTPIVIIFMSKLYLITEKLNKKLYSEEDMII